jgi:hypothetical protein
MFVYECRPDGAIAQHHKNVQNTILRAGLAYATVWNQAALRQTQLNKADLVIPVAKKEAQADDVASALEPFAKAFGIEVSLMMSMAQHIDPLVKQAVSSSPKEMMAKKGKAKEKAPSITPPPAQYPPSANSAWIRDTAEELLWRAPEMVLAVRPSESATLKYAIVFELLSILAHRRFFVEKTAAGNAVRILFQTLLDSNLVEGQDAYIFPDGLGVVSPLGAEELKAAKKRQHDDIWCRRITSLMTRLSRVNLSLTSEESDDEEAKAFTSIVKSGMLDVITVSSHKSSVFCNSGQAV